MKTKVGLLLPILIIPLLSACRPPKNGTNYACYLGTTMDIHQSEGGSTVIYTCGEDGNNFTTVFNVPDDDELFDVIREEFTKTDRTTGVILDAEGNLVQLYRIALLGLTEYWPID